jgi:hypothetical protein
MNRLERIALYALCAVTLLFPLVGCGLLTPMQRSAAGQTIENEYEMGRITAAQRDAALEALDSKTGMNWDALLQAGGNVLMSVLLGVPVAVGVVRRQRGPVATPAERVARKAATSQPTH